MVRHALENSCVSARILISWRDYPRLQTRVLHGSNYRIGALGSAGYGPQAPAGCRSSGCWTHPLGPRAMRSGLPWTGAAAPGQASCTHTTSHAQTVLMISGQPASSQDTKAHTDANDVIGRRNMEHFHCISYIVCTHSRGDNNILESCLRLHSLPAVAASAVGTGALAALEDGSVLEIVATAFLFKAALPSQASTEENVSVIIHSNL